MKDIVGDYRERFRLQRKALRRYTALLLALAMITTLFVNWQLHSDGIAATAQYQCNQEEHTHTADCYTKVLVCGYEEGQPEDWNATFDDSASLDESIGVDAEDDGIALFSAEPEYIYVPHEHTDDCYQEVKTLTCLEEEHVHGDDCFDPEDGSLICEQFEHVHDDSCYTTDYELVCGLEDGELVEELNPAYTAVAAFEAPVAAKPVVVSPVIEAPIHYHTDDCYEEVLTCGLEEHHHTVNCLADPLADVEDESEWLAKTSTSLSGDWSADLLTVAQSQLGYTQSEKNFEVDADDGVTVRHYTRYGEWYGNPYGEWDVMFLSYCLNYAGIPQSAIPQRAGVLALRSDLRGAGYLMDPQSIPAAQQDAIALCDEGLPEEESFADADADDLGFADGASSFCSIQPGDIVFYNTMVTETVAVDDTPAVVEDDSPDADIALLSLDPVETEPQTEQRTVTYETVGIVSDVDEDAGTLSVISGNVDGNVAEVALNASDVTALVSVASAQAVAGDGTDTLETVNGLKGNSYVTNFKLQKESDGQAVDSDTFVLTETVYGYLKLEAIPAEKIIANDYKVYIDLPDAFDCGNNVGGSLGENRGKYSFVKSDDDDHWILVLEYDKTFIEQEKATSASKVDSWVRFNFKWDEEQINKNNKNDFKINENNTVTVTINEKKNDSTTKDDDVFALNKSKSKLRYDGGKAYIDYTVTLSVNQEMDAPFSITDTLTTTGGVTFTYTDTAPEITFSTGSAPAISWKDGSGTSKVITLGEKDGTIAAGTYTITYTVVCNDPPHTLEQDSKVKNKIRASYKDESHEDSTETKLKNDMISKSGKHNSKKGYIEWTVKINTPTSDGSLAYLENGATFTDTLPDDLVDGEIKVKMDGGKSSTVTLTADQYDAERKTITYPLAEGRHYYEITYKTKAPENTGLTDITVSNTGTVNNGSTTSSDTDEVTISSNILSKKLEGGTTADGTATMDWSTTISADDLNGYTYYDWSGVLTDSDGKWCKAQKIVPDSVKVITEDNKNVTDKVTIHYDYSKMDDSHSEVDVGLFSVDFSGSNITGPVTITYQTTTNAAALPSGNTTIYNYGKLNDGKTVSDKYSFKNDNAAVDVVRKQGTFDESTGTLTYNVMVNPTGRQLLDEENGQLLLYDFMKFSDALSGDKKTQYLWLEGISVYKGEFVNGEYVPTTFLRELTPVSGKYDDITDVNTKIVSTTEYYAKYDTSFTQVKTWTKVPDATPLVLVFHYTVDTSHVLSTKPLNFTNDVTLQGNPSWSTSNKDVSFTPTTDGGASINYNNDRLTIFKYGDTVNHPLEGAEFLLEKWDADQKQWVTVNDSIKTNSKGNDVLSVGRDTLYRILETKAPAGYLMPRGNAYYYFRVTRSTDAYTPPDGSDVIAADVHTYQVTTGKDNTYQTFYYNVANEKDPDYVPTGSLKVTKLWQDSNGDAITDSAKLGELPTVTVTLTKHSDGGSTQIGDPVTLNNDNGWTSTWSDLEASDGIYYTIEESAMDGYTTRYRLAGSEHLYDTCPNISVSGANGASVQIVNQSTRAGYELPSTGGAGTTLYTAVGGTMVLAALVCGFCQKRRRERRAD